MGVSPLYFFKYDRDIINRRAVAGYPAICPKIGKTVTCFCQNDLKGMSNCPSDNVPVVCYSVSWSVQCPASRNAGSGRCIPAENHIIPLFCRINKIFCRYDNFLFRLQNFLSDPQAGLNRPASLIKFVNGTTCKIQIYEK